MEGIKSYLWVVVIGSMRYNHNMKVLVTGAAGYIGSFMTKKLLDEGYQVVALDSLEKGQKVVVDTRATVVVGDVGDTDLLKKTLQVGFDVVVHFAGYIAVGESMQKPEKYFRNNTFVSLQLLEGMRQHNIKNIIFSSTAAVYGNPTQVPIPEDHPKNPTSPYGESKFMTENLLRWYNALHGINFVALRYFNACGAELDGSMGERHIPETHIIPNAIAAVLDNKPFQLFGNDYKTSDGTCVRDYIHVKDLITAHMLAMQKLEKENGGFFYNVGTGNGFSNKEVIDMVKKVTGNDFSISLEQRRDGDADTLIADATRIQKDLGFSPKYSDLTTIVSSAWEWHKKQH